MSSGLIDVSVAARVAARFASAGPLDRSYLLDDLQSHFDELVREAEPLIAEETGFVVKGSAVAKVLSRNEWATANVDSMLSLMAPLLDKFERRVGNGVAAPVVRLAYRPALGAQLGTVLGFLSQRVLGQYDVLKGHNDQVWFVGPNIVVTERRFGFVPRDFRLWVVLHEMTHRAQFEGNPWMRDYFHESVGRLLDSMDVDTRTLVDRVMKGIRSSSTGPLTVRLLSDEQKEIFEGLQAFMSVIEGHGNFVMDRVAESTIPTQPRMRQTLRDSGSPSGVILRLIGKLLGLELKKAQYLEGQKFFDHVFEEGGRDAVSACFRSAADLPTLEEVRAPQKWLARVHH